MDDSLDITYREKVSDMCAGCCLETLTPFSAKIKSLSGLFTGQALTLPYYKNHKMKKWVDATLASRNISHVLVFSSAMAQYVCGDEYKHIKRVIDFVDVDTDKWKQYAASKTWPASIIYSREGRKLLEYDISVANQFDACVFVSEAEVKLFNSLSEHTTKKTFYINNGVDYEYFSLDRSYSNPYKKEEAIIVFTGAMDYWANVDAVEWFSKAVFPFVKEQCVNAKFYVVGSNPTKRVKSLERIEGITVTGRVQDVRPYLSHARVAVAPLRIARGVQNKVLEALSMGLTVIATDFAMAGITEHSGLKIHIENEAKSFAQKVIQHIDKKDSFNAQNRLFVQKKYDWTKNLNILQKLLCVTEN